MSNLFSSDAIQGEVALVTGASRGIGAQIAQALAAAGATVIGTATSESVLRRSQMHSAVTGVVSH